MHPVTVWTIPWRSANKSEIWRVLISLCFYSFNTETLSQGRTLWPYIRCHNIDHTLQVVVIDWQCLQGSHSFLRHSLVLLFRCLIANRKWVAVALPVLPDVSPQYRELAAWTGHNVEWALSVVVTGKAYQGSQVVASRSRIPAQDLAATKSSTSKLRYGLSH